MARLPWPATWAEYRRVDEQEIHDFYNFLFYRGHGDEDVLNSVAEIPSAIIRLAPNSPINAPTGTADVRKREVILMESSRATRKMKRDAVGNYRMDLNRHLRPMKRHWYGSGKSPRDYLDYMIYEKLSKCEEQEEEEEYQECQPDKKKTKRG